MVIFKSQKHIFWQALVLTLIIFNIGVFLGYSLEASRVKKISSSYVQSELQFLDVRIQNEIFSVADVDCERAIEENIEFADRIYEEAKTLKKYEDARRLNDKIIFEHKKYDLLRTLFWINSIKLKENCNADYHNVVYLYNYDEEDLEKRAKQRVFSNLLAELKQKYGNKIMLIPIAGNMDLSSIDILLTSYKIDKLPVILIDEEIKITELSSVEELEVYL